MSYALDVLDRVAAAGDHDGDHAAELPDLDRDDAEILARLALGESPSSIMADLGHRDARDPPHLLAGGRAMNPFTNSLRSVRAAQSRNRTRGLGLLPAAAIHLELGISYGSMPRLH